MASAAPEAKWSPKSGRLAVTEPSSVATVTSVCAVAWSSSTRSMRTVAPVALPALITGAGPRAASVRTRASSALSTAHPSAGSAATSSPFAAAIASRSPAREACTASIAVTTPTRGRAIAQRSAISPPTYIPISATSRSAPSGRLRSASGRPISLLAFPGVALVFVAAPPSAAAISSFVVVFPTEPVTPITSRSKRARQLVAAAASARTPESTRRSVAPCFVAATFAAAMATSSAAPSPACGATACGAAAELGRSATTAAAPRSRASTMCRRPSVRSPGSAKKISPSATSRESTRAPRIARKPSTSNSALTAPPRNAALVISAASSAPLRASGPETRVRGAALAVIPATPRVAVGVGPRPTRPRPERRVPARRAGRGKSNRQLWRRGGCPSQR